MLIKGKLTNTLKLVRSEELKDQKVRLIITCRRLLYTSSQLMILKDKIDA